MILNKQLFLGYVLLFISIFTSMLFTLFQEYDLRSNYDAYNYLSGYNFLSENPFNISGSRDFFGRFPEFIFVYFISIISIFGKINDVG